MQTAWFWILFVLWSLYFVTEGFDFGVGMLLPVLGRSEDDRRTMIQTIGPVWDGNEVWLIIAGAATFAAFPVWYATMFSGFYVALLLLLVLLITRIVSFEWRGKAESGTLAQRLDLGEHDRLARHPADLGHRALEPAPRRPDLVGAGVHRHVLGSLHARTRSLAGVALVALFALHGAVYLGLRTNGDLRARAERCGRAARRAGRARRRRVPRLDARRRKRQQRPGPLPGDRRRRPRPPSPPSPRSCFTRRRREGLAFAATGRDDRPRGRHAVHRALSARDGLVDRASPTASPRRTRRPATTRSS